MAIVINGSGTVTGLAVGGLPDGTVDAGTLATNSVDSAELIDGAVDDSHIAALTASKLTGALPAISAANLTAIPAANVTGTLPAIDGSNLTGISSAAGTSHFHAIFGSGGWQTYAANTKIGFNATFRNVGTDFDTTNNRYVAPATGVYYFYYLAYTALNDTTNGFTFRKNGLTNDLVDRDQAVTTFNEQGAGDHTQTGTLVVNLSANDYIEVWAFMASDFYPGNSSFGGFRIS
jgi:hypothetical protein